MPIPRIEILLQELTGKRKPVDGTTFTRHVSTRRRKNKRGKK